MNRIDALRTIPWVALVTAIACGDGGIPGTNAGSGMSASGAAITGMSGGPSGVSAGSGASSGDASAGSTSGAVTGSGSSGTFAPSGANSGVAASGGGSGAAGSGVAVSGASGTGAASGGASSGNPSTKGRTGMKSAGCGKLPMGAVATTFTNHRISIPACAACTVPNCPKNCIAPPFAPGGVNAQAGAAANGETFLDRDYTIELPAGYDPNHPYAVFYGANGCGPTPPLMGAAFSVSGENGAIKVGLQQVGDASNPMVGNCFADGGIRCAPNIANVAACVNGPEIPYFLAVMNWVESNFCVDLGTEFVGGGSSGAWEALLAGCAAANTLRGIYTLAGGLREHRWPCDGPIAAFMIASDVDMNNPVGPLPKLFVIEDSYGMAPARDEILTRNGCVGKATAPYDPKYPFCVKYTGCPATYPVVWCEFPGGSHDNPNYNGVDYSTAVAPFLLGLPPAP